MAVEIGALRALLSLDSAAFESGAKRAQASMNGIQRRLTKLGGNMRKFGRDMSLRVTAPIVASAGLAVRSSLKTVDAQAKMAQSLDTSVVSVQNLTRASDLAGISQGELEGSLLRMTRRISLAEKGTGPAVKALDRLNLSAAELNDLPVDERVNKINQAIRELIPEAQQAGISSEIFGDRTGLAMQRLDPSTIARATDEVRRFGVSVSDIDADKIESANDAMSSIGLVTQGLANRLTVALAPVLEDVANKIANVAAWFSNLSPEMQRMVGMGAVVAAAIGPVAIGLGFVATGIAALISPVGAVVIGLGAVAGVAAYVVTQWDEMKARFPFLERVADIGGQLAEAWGDLPAIKWALLIPALRWARFIPGIRWAAFIPKISWIAVAGALKWGALIARLSWAALRVIPGIGWVALAGSLAWSMLVKQIEWSGWIPSVQWADWITRINWSDWIPTIDWSRVFGNAAPNIAAESEKFGRDLGAGIARGLKTQKAPTEDELRGFMRDLEGAARDETETQSPSRVFMRLGHDLMDGLGLGIQQRTQVAVDALKEGVDQMGGSLDGLGDSADQTSRRFGDMVAGIATGSQTIGGAISSLGMRLASSGISGLAGGLANSLGLGDLFAGFFDRGGMIPAGQFGIAAEKRDEFVNGTLVRGPARVTGGAETSRMLSGGQAARIEVVARVENGNITQHVQQVAGNVAVQVMSEGLADYDRNQLPGSVERINSDPRRIG